MDVVFLFVRTHEMSKPESGRKSLIKTILIKRGKCLSDDFELPHTSVVQLLLSYAFCILCKNTGEIKNKQFAP